MNLLRENQKKAIQFSINNKFKSGVHFHATGTGKSWIALEIILKYNNKYKNKNILWLCEQKSILKQQFNKEVIRRKGYSDIYNKFFIINYTEKKPQKWYEEVNNAIKWKKPILLVINRSFLVSRKKYEKLNLSIDLIIHDECHSIKNKTTKTFYEYILNKNKNISCLGFSATPYLEIKPFDNILTEYTIYDAFCDDIIVPPKISWVKSDNKFQDIDFINVCKEKIKDLHYKKLIVWCGIIDKCYELSELWKEHFENFFIAVDTSKDTDNLFDKYQKKECNAILFCACKHREGSDILNLDGCIFLDKVENRNPKTFVQCIGRVLRKDKDNKKTFGLVLDLKANSCIKICDRMNEYLNAKSSFPWQYNYYNKRLNNKNFILHDLVLVKKDNIIKNNLIEYTIDDVKNRFVRQYPDEKKYHKRLKKELKIIDEKKLSNYLIRATKILDMTNNIPHVTRGSCGSSLVCYLLGISNVDPVKHKIKFARFLNKYRENLPDIDFDFPHYLRDEVFLKLELEWPNQVARISNHVHWHEKSALREAIRKIGIKKRIPKEDIYNFVKSLSKSNQIKIKQYQKELENTFRHYSLHCGGIVFFHDGVPDNLIINKKTLNQIMYDKRDVAKTSQFKIDILSSKGISQLMDICGRDIDFSDCPYDEKTYKLLQSGNNIGITLAESPLMRKALIKIKPESIRDIAICLAIIRPAAKDARLKDTEIDYNAEFIYDDDAIKILSKTLDIKDDLADKFRRCLCKNKWKKGDKLKFDNLLMQISDENKKDLLDKLNNLRKYSFCKSHSYSYAQLVYKLAYQKAHNPKKFWKSTLKNANSSYRKWVHLYEAHRNGVDINRILNKEKDVSLYAENRRKKFYNLSIQDQLTRFGYWDMTKTEFFPNCYFYKKNNIYYFGGLIASLRVLDWKKKIIVSFICVGNGQYIELITYGSYYNAKNYAVKGRAHLKSKKERSIKAFVAKYY